MAVQELKIDLEVLRERLTPSRQLEDRARTTRDEIVERDGPEVALAELAALIAEQVRSNLEQNVSVLEKLVHENHLLRKKIANLSAANEAAADALKKNQAIEDTDDEPEDDDRSFGTHIREAINVIRGR